MFWVTVGFLVALISAMVAAGLIFKYDSSYIEKPSIVVLAIAMAYIAVFACPPQWYSTLHGGLSRSPNVEKILWEDNVVTFPEHVEYGALWYVGNDQSGTGMQPVHGLKYVAQATQNDLWVWIQYPDGVSTGSAKIQKMPTQ